jgi:hypothetical protein
MCDISSTVSLVLLFIDLFKRDIILLIFCYLRFEFVHKKSFQLKIMTVITIVSLIGYIETPIYGYNTVRVSTNALNQTTTSWQCNLKSLYFYQAFSIVMLIQVFFIPCALMLTSSILIIRGLANTRKRIEAHENREMKSRKAKDIKFAISSIVLNVLFIVLTSPQMMNYIITFSDKTTSALYAYSTVLIYSVNLQIVIRPSRLKFDI